MAIDVIHRPRPVLPEPPAPADLELQFDGLQGVRDELADLLTDPFFEPLRAGIDAQLARIYRAIRATDRPCVCSWHVPGHPEQPLESDSDREARLVAEGDAIADRYYDAHDAPAGAGDDVESYRG